MNSNEARPQRQTPTQTPDMDSASGAPDSPLADMARPRGNHGVETAIPTPNTTEAINPHTYDVAWEPVPKLDKAGRTPFWTRGRKITAVVAGAAVLGGIGVGIKESSSNSSGPVTASEEVIDSQPEGPILEEPAPTDPQPEAPEVVDPLDDPFSPESLSQLSLEELEERFVITGDSAPTIDDFVEEFASRLSAIHNMKNEEFLDNTKSDPSGASYIDAMLPYYEAAAAGLLGTPNQDSSGMQSLTGIAYRQFLSDILGLDNPAYRFSVTIDQEPVITELGDGLYSVALPLHFSDNSQLAGPAFGDPDGAPVSYRGIYHIPAAQFKDGIWHINGADFVLTPEN